ncbi:MAG: DUF3035 domain-containing protein [Paracoccaceae bacterium]
MRHSGRIGLLLAAALVLSACAAREPDLFKISDASGGPDEFSILPGNPLQSPASYTVLPSPTPGGSNLADPTPKADAVDALGGNRSLVGRAGIPAADRALLNYTSRFGVQSDVRQVLAAADLSLRRRVSGFSIFRPFVRNRYFAAYRNQSLDKYLELARLRAAGITTPSAPPRPGG